jgi:hypothetical protein
MLHIEKPNDSAEAVFLLTISRVRDANLAMRLNGCVQNVINFSNDLDNRVVPSTLHLIQRNANVNGNVSKEEMKAVYESRMVGLTSPGRPIYDRIILSAKNELCPLCAQRQVTQIDHHLPKSYYPELVVAPYNLIPSCSECNTGKLHRFPNSIEEQTFHPYYDNIDNDLWLDAIVNNTSPPSLTYIVTPPSNWSIRLANRIQYHFNEFSLNNLYSTQAAAELNQIKTRLRNIYSVGGQIEVSAHLREEFISRSSVNLNSWQSAMYRTLKADTWFCDGGFDS